MPSGSRSSDLPPSPLCTGSDERTPLADAALRYFNVRAVLEAAAGAVLVSAAAFTVVGGVWRWRVLVVGAVLVAAELAVETLVLNPRRVARTSYAVGPHAVHVTRGAVLRRSLVIATRQILSVETIRGPILAHLGLRTVRFRLLADVESLGPVSPAAAAAIRRAVAHAGEDHDSRRHDGGDHDRRQHDGDDHDGREHNGGG